MLMMLYLSRLLGVIILVFIYLATSKSESQNNQNQGKPLGSPHNHVKTQNDIKYPENVESQSNDEVSVSNFKSHENIDMFKHNNFEKSNGESEIKHNDKQDTLTFEEEGEVDEPLVEQMKRLSEKINEVNGARNTEMTQDEKKMLDRSSLEQETDNFKLKAKNEQREIEEGAIHLTVATGQFNNDFDEQQKQTFGKPDIAHFLEEESKYTEQTKEIINNEKKPVPHLANNILSQDEHKALEEHLKEKTESIRRPEVIPSHEHVTQNKDEEKTLSEQMKENIDNMNLPVLTMPDYADDFPDDTMHDPPSEYLEPSTGAPISNTLPPLPDMASQTLENTVELASSEAREMTADEMVLSSTPTLSDMAEKKTDKVEQTEIKATANADFDFQTSTFLGIKNTGKNFRLQKKKLNKLGENEKKRHETADLRLAKSIDQTAATVNVQSKDLYTNDIGKTLKFTGTVQDTNQMTERPIDSSKNLPEGTVLETAKTFMEKDASKMMTEIHLKNAVPNSATLAKPNEDNEVPSMTQMLDSSETPITKTDRNDVSYDKEPVLTEEEKQKIAQAQKYFEQGEKLVNNSYKKDFIQAYEYFKLAADLGHSKALEYVGFGHLLGDYISLDPEKALKIFTDLNEKGHPRGQLGLGFCYGSGLAVNSSQAKALIYFTFAALGGDPFAQMVLGYRYLSGIGVESKCETALQFYRKVATTVAENTSSGSPVVQRIRLHEQADNKDNGVSLMDADLLQYYEFLADKGDLQAQVVLGQLYYQGGRGVPINHERAHHYFLMASESGNANALAFLGKMHSEGSPYIKQDNLTAYQYFKKAGDKGNPVGLCGMGIMHFHGRGVEKDYSKALRYFSLSADQGWSDGQLQLGLMHYSGKGVKRDYKQAVRYLNLASQGGHVLAFYHLAQMHATGVGVMRNCHTAVELYKNVAERGNWASMLMEAHQLYKEGYVNEALLKYTFLAELGYEVAQTNVAFILDQGESSLFTDKETYQRALLQWTRAASQGSTMARLKMGDYHYYGYGTDIDYETAATHYRMATEQQHNAQAMFNLGYMHEQGLGLKQDVHLAKRFYDMAAETSGDAYVPVTLALVKLGLFYGIDVFNKELEGYNNILNRLDVRYQLGPNWDIYIATFLAIVLGIVVVIRRQR